MITTPEYTGPERRTSERQWKQYVEERLAEGELQMHELKQKIDYNTMVTNRIDHNTGEIVSAFNDAKVAFRFFAKMSRLLKPIIGLVTAVVGAYLWFKGHLSWN